MPGGCTGEVIRLSPRDLLPTWSSLSCELSVHRFAVVAVVVAVVVVVIIVVILLLPSADRAVLFSVSAECLTSSARRWRLPVSALLLSAAAAVLVRR